MLDMGTARVACNGVTFIAGILCGYLLTVLRARAVSGGFQRLLFDLLLVTMGVVVGGVFVLATVFTAVTLELVNVLPVVTLALGAFLGNRAGVGARRLRERMERRRQHAAFHRRDVE